MKGESSNEDEEDSDEESEGSSSGDGKDDDEKSLTDEGNCEKPFLLVWIEKTMSLRNIGAKKALT